MSSNVEYTVCHSHDDRGHTSYVNSVIFTKDGSNALTASSDGCVRLWDVKTTESLLSFRLLTLAFG